MKLSCSNHFVTMNRWSAIAARLLGRTDNDIKNARHTHLKKRLKLTNLIEESKKRKVQPK